MRNLLVIQLEKSPMVFSIFGRLLRCDLGEDFFTTEEKQWLKRQQSEVKEDKFWKCNCLKNAYLGYYIG